jgi:hypothetical protein
MRCSSVVFLQVSSDLQWSLDKPNALFIQEDIWTETDRMHVDSYAI